MTMPAQSGPTAWTGWVYFAGVVAFMVGCLNVIQGLVALFKDEVYLVAGTGLVVTTDYTAWGAALLIWGVVLILAAFGLFSGAEWARWLAIFVVAINVIGQFAFFAAFPLWSLVVIGLGSAVLFALTVRWDEAVGGVRG